MASFQVNTSNFSDGSSLILTRWNWFLVWNESITLVEALQKQVYTMFYYLTAYVWVFQSFCCCNNLNLKLWSGYLDFLPRIQSPCFESDIIVCYCLGICIFFLRSWFFFFFWEYNASLAWIYFINYSLYLFKYGTHKVMIFLFPLSF